jgi:hypothetical protein
MIPLKNQIFCRKRMVRINKTQFVQRLSFNESVSISVENVEKCRKVHQLQVSSRKSKLRTLLVILGNF